MTLRSPVTNGGRKGVRTRTDRSLLKSAIQRAFGCTGSEVWSELIASGDRPLEDWLRGFRLGTETETNETGAAEMSVLASALSYLPRDRIAALGSLSRSFPDVTVIAETPYQAVVVSDDRLIIVAFRGTDNAQNWRRNFNVIPAATALGTVHGGFLAGYRALSSGVLEAVAAVWKGQPVWLTGHSLGGAIAVLAAPDIQTITGQLQRVVTFGQPPVGYPAFARAWDAMFPQRLVRYVNHRDAVVGVGALLTHVGQLRYFDTAGRLHVGRAPMTQMFRDAVCAPSFESGAEFGAHYIRRYLILIAHASKR